MVDYMNGRIEGADHVVYIHTIERAVVHVHTYITHFVFFFVDFLIYVLSPPLSLLLGRCLTFLSLFTSFHIVSRYRAAFSAPHVF